MKSARVIAVALAVLAPGAFAQGLPDPTRPPATLYNAAGSGGSARSGPQLQSVLVSQGRRVAVIDGETYRVGDSYQGKRLVSVSDSEVVLAQGRQRQVLKLYPAAAPQ